MEQFRAAEKDVLVATDVASKGLDFPDIQHVINYDMPEDIENYGEYITVGLTLMIDLWPTQEHILPLTCFISNPAGCLACPLPPPPPQSTVHWGCQLL